MSQQEMGERAAREVVPPRQAVLEHRVVRVQPVDPLKVVVSLHYPATSRLGAISSWGPTQLPPTVSLLGAILLSRVLEEMVVRVGLVTLQPVWVRPVGRVEVPKAAVFMPETAM